MKRVSFCKENVDFSCGRLCAKDDLTHIMTRLALIEGHVLERLEHAQIMTLHELIETLECEPCAIAMAVGSLVRQGTIRSWEEGRDVFLEHCDHGKS